jgi:nucleotide-binding universal stress UspA family protein
MFVVVGVDGSEASRHAIDVAIELARPLGAAIRLVHVRRPALVAMEAQPMLAPKIEEALAAESEALLDHAREHAATRGVEAQTQSFIGSEADQLARSANSPDVAMLVVGSHGRGALGRFFLGSVATTLARICPRPVLVVPPR